MASFIKIHLADSSTMGDKTIQHSLFFVPRALFASEITDSLKKFVDSRGTNVKRSKM